MVQLLVLHDFVIIKKTDIVFKKKGDEKFVDLCGVQLATR